MPHVLEPAATGRSKCRGCKQPLQKGELRFGEQLANPFGEGEVTHWFHPRCAAYKRPDAVSEALAASADGIADREELERIAGAGLANARLPRIDGAERSPSGQARCRHCHQPIEKGAWRIRLAFHQEGNFSPGGFLHPACCAAYLESTEFVERVLHFSPGVDGAEIDSLRRELAP
jgi:hypothetical protein